jgi:class 3 adenylate cyclase
MADAIPDPPVPRPEIGQEDVLETAVLFMDLVASSEFASVLGLRDYAKYVDSFENLCLEQCAYFFDVVHKNKEWKRGHDYEYQFVGDELVVFMHTTLARQNIYQLLALAMTLKCGWLGTSINAARLKAGAPSAELAAGIHIGNVWSKHSETGHKRRGFSINVAKRIESASREGQNFRIFMSDPAMKRVNLRTRHLLFSPRKILPMKGVVVPVGVYEVVDCFLNPETRLAPRLFEGFRSVAHNAIGANSYDLWIHSCLQVSEEARNNKRVTDANLELCKRTLNIDPSNASALYHAGQAMREREKFETALLYYLDLTNCWPGFADGWLELGKVYKKLGDMGAAHRAILQARRHGIPEEEEALPE